MSLDIYLSDFDAHCGRDDQIFIRENGATRRITRKEWDERYPGIEPVFFQQQDVPTSWSINITHNMTAMAKACGLYDVMWRPNENNIKRAGDAIEKIRAGLQELKTEPARFQQFNPKNGWGNYEVSTSPSSTWRLV